MATSSMEEKLATLMTRINKVEERPGFFLNQLIHVLLKVKYRLYKKVIYMKGWKQKLA